MCSWLARASHQRQTRRPRLQPPQQRQQQQQRPKSLQGSSRQRSGSRSSLITENMTGRRAGGAANATTAAVLVTPGAALSERAGRARAAHMAVWYLLLIDSLSGRCAAL